MRTPYTHPQPTLACDVCTLYRPIRTLLHLLSHCFYLFVSICVFFSPSLSLTYFSINRKKPIVFFFFFFFDKEKNIPLSIHLVFYFYFPPPCFLFGFLSSFFYYSLHTCVYLYPPKPPSLSQSLICISNPLVS